MAPTETLAEQHFLTIEGICAQLGVRCALLTGSVRGDVPNVGVVVGTHALIQARRRPARTSPSRSSTSSTASASSSGRRSPPDARRTSCT